MNTPREVLLAIDTSGPGAGLALAADDRVDTMLLPVREGGAARTEDLASCASALLGARGLRSSDLSGLGAVVGPGSYTGLRSGLAFARGLAFPGKLPAVAVPSLELLAWRQARVGETVLAAWPASQGLTLAGVFERTAEDVVARSATEVVADAECTSVLARMAANSAALAAPAERADSLAGAAKAAGIALRPTAGDGLAALVALVASRWKRGLAARALDLVPVYVGQSTARPNRARVAVAEATE
jgi:tRNA threonylcarbamoyladenosine biosynthesis protein TsaB